MTKEPYDFPSQFRASRGGRLAEMEYDQMERTQEPISIDFASEVIPIQPQRLQVRMGSLKDQPDRTEQIRVPMEINLKRSEPRIGRPGRRFSRGGVMDDKKGE